MTKQRLVGLLGEVRKRWPDLGDPEATIGQGRIHVDGAPVSNPRTLVSRASAITLHDGVTTTPGEQKMQAALRAFALDVRGAVALDAGAAAGGFTKAVLDAGARRVYAVDVGHGQLRGFLRQDPRVVVLERTNIAELSTTLVPERIDLISLDLSCVSLRAAAPQLNGLDISDSAVLVALVKPMFELELGRYPSPSSGPVPYSERQPV